LLLAMDFDMDALQEYAMSWVAYFKGVCAVDEGA
jgi:hypothetical protein